MSAFSGISRPVYESTGAMLPGQTTSALCEDSSATTTVVPWLVTSYSSSANSRGSRMQPCEAG